MSHFLLVCSHLLELYDVCFRQFPSLGQVSHRLDLLLPGKDDLDEPKEEEEDLAPIVIAEPFDAPAPVLPFQPLPDR